MKYQTFNFDYESIEKHLDSIQTNIKKIEYLLFIKKEIEIVIVEYTRIIEKLTMISGIFNSNEEIQEVLNEMLLKEKNDEIKYFINANIKLAKEDNIWGDSNPTPGFPELGKMYSIKVSAKPILLCRAYRIQVIPD